MTSFEDTYPAPEPDAVTAPQMAGYRAVEALWLLGRAERRRELHGVGDSEAIHMFVHATTKAEVAYAVYAAHKGADADHIGYMLLLNQEEGEATEHRVEEIARRAGHDPYKARRAGYES